MVVSKTNEQSLEMAIEKHLTGACLEELIGTVDSPVEHLGEARINYSGKYYEQGLAADFDPHYAIDTRYFW